MVPLFWPVCFSLALMLLVFAVWALAGFGYPSALVPIALNVASKLLAFVTALSLFVPEWFTRPGSALRCTGSPPRQTRRGVRPMAGLSGPYLDVAGHQDDETPAPARASARQRASGRAP